MLTQRAPGLPDALAALVVVLVVLGIHLVLARRALADLARADRQVRTWTKETWMTVIVLVGIVGPLAYFRYGRDIGW